MSERATNQKVTKAGRCADCGQSVSVTKRGLARRHSCWHQRGLSLKSGRYWHHCNGSGKPAVIR